MASRKFVCLLKNTNRTYCLDTSIGDGRGAQWAQSMWFWTSTLLVVSNFHFSLQACLCHPACDILVSFTAIFLGSHATLWGSVAWHPQKRLQRRLRKNPRLLFLLSHLPLAIAVVVSRSPHYRSKNGHLWKGHRKSAIHCAHTQSQVLQSDWPRIRNHYSAHVQKFGPYTQRSQLLVLNKRSAISG